MKKLLEIIKKIKRNLTGRVMKYIIFWSWNLILAVFGGAFFIPKVLGHIWLTTLEGLTPWSFTFFASMSFIVGLLSIILGLSLLRKDADRLITWFYGVEIPLIGLSILRLVLLRALNPGTTHLLLLSLAGLAGLLVWIFKGSSFRNKYSASLQLTALCCLLLVAVYISAVLLFYIIPIVWLILKSIFDLNMWEGLWKAVLSTYGLAFFYMLISMLMFAYAATLFIVFPYTFIRTSLRVLKETWQRLGNLVSRKVLVVITLAVMIINILLFIILNLQPQAKVFALLEDEVTEKTEMRSLSAREGLIRRGLINAYLSPYRYVSSVKENRHIVDIYRESFGFPEGFNECMQSAYNGLMQPFLYKGEFMYFDQRKAEKLYEKFFDTTIQRGERKKVIRAMRARWDQDEVEAGLVNIDARRVLLKHQEIRLKEEHFADQVEIYEVYENKTAEAQEILYYFALPPNAVITGLWLGNSSNRQERFAFRVSPRGAAQQVYKNQVRRSIDPSLLEQVGPRQYRLRAFPIPGTARGRIITRGRGPVRSRISDDGDVPAFHLWLTYSVINDGSDQVRLPELLEKRNIYFSSRTRRMINGVDTRRHIGWLPEGIERPGSKGKVLGQCSVALENKKIQVAAIKSSDVTLKDLSIAVLVDGSYSMKRCRERIRQEINTLDMHKSSLNKLDIFLMGSEIKQYKSGPEFLADDPLYYGVLLPVDMLKSVKKSLSDDYDGIIFITDEAAYELDSSAAEPIVFNSPLIFIHVSEQLPNAYHDSVLGSLLKSKGDICQDMDEALLYLSLKSGNREFIDLDGNYLWTYTDDMVQDGTEALMPVSASKYIKSHTAEIKNGNLAGLDSIHSVAKKHKIVSPFSSMIVLVNERQHKELDQAEKAADRFDREVETGKEQISKPSNLFKGSAVPEPEEWLLFFITLAMLAYLYCRKYGFLKLMRR